MTLQEWLDANGYTKEAGGNKACCPFHDDTTYSALVNPNSLWCFSCARLYTLRDFWERFGVRLDYVNVEDSEIKKMRQLGETILFSYKFKR